MRKIIAILLCAMALAFVSCQSEPSEGNKWFEAPATGEVSGTSVVVSCTTTFGDGVLAQGEVGVAYAPLLENNSLGDFVSVKNATIEGKVITCRLTNLAPETTYLFYAFAELGGKRMQSPASSFVTGKGDDTPPPPVAGEPSFNTPSSSGVTTNAATISCEFAYTGEKPISRVYFRYGASSESPVSTTTPGVKSVQLTGLNASTRYAFTLCVEIDGKSYSSAESSFTTEGTVIPPIPGDTKYSGWAELPVEVKNSDYYYAYHICPTFKVQGHLARNFTVCYSAEHHCPVWVAAPLHTCYLGDSGNRNYGPDPVIPRDIQPSSKTVASPYNKGHMLGNRERSGDSGMNKQVSYYTNMAPQHATNFNTGGGAWNNLEDHIDKLWCNDTLYMVSGCRFESWTDSYGNTATAKKTTFGGKSASVPTAFFYVLLRTKSGASGKSVANCTAAELQCAGFVISHAMPKGHRPEARDMRSVKEIEDMFGLQFFTNVPNAPKNTYTPADWLL